MNCHCKFKANIHTRRPLLRSRQQTRSVLIAQGTFVGWKLISLQVELAALVDRIVIELYMRLRQY
jgi:hypothetical protein